jgi:excisionase family DNA binding protein
MSEAVVEIVLDGLTLDAIATRVAAILQAEDVETEARPPSPYLTIPEAADYLRCRRQRIDDLLSQRRLTRVKEGSRTLVLRAEIEKHLVRYAARGGA